ncbi:uncharacterized protein LOC142632929 [Castanea sativa]|uniref:uncharacterized protein LOC142632929 n=1 Tax=Castanea sativa TaxID=21020 RepID=UPI003F65002F
MVAEMQMMKERMNFMMNAFKGRVLSDLDELVHRTDSAFTAPVTSFPLPPKFRMSQIKDDTTLTWPGKLKGNPNKRSRNKYCHFHRDHDHDTSEYYDLKQQIEALIRLGKLQRLVSKEMIDPPQEQATRRENERLRPPIGDIRMIVEGTTISVSSRKARKTYLKMVQTIQLMGFVSKMARIDNPINGFTEEDARCLHHPHDDALLVSIRVGHYNTYWVLVDNGSFTDILYYSSFQ